MYKISESTDVREFSAHPPIGPGFIQEQILGAVKMEVWGTTFLDKGEDYCEFRLFNIVGQQIAKKRLEGY